VFDSLTNCPAKRHLKLIQRAIDLCEDTSSSYQVVTLSAVWVATFISASRWGGVMK
jgi:hypothetical protein